MGGFLYIILIFIALIILQIILSLRSNKYLGWIIPCVNLIGSVFISMQFSDIFLAFLGFFISMVPMMIWLGIYTAIRRNMDKKKQNEINRMRINDL